jgi:iron(III) transport system substrate-binding protein
VRRLAALTLAATLLAAGCGGDDPDTLTVYSGRSEELVGPLFERFEEAAGIDVEVRYADSPTLAATLREEGGSTPADVFWAQDPASLGAVALADLFEPLPAGLLGRVPDRFSDGEGRWVGTSGRARVLVYDPDRLGASGLPERVEELAGPGWEGLAVAPTNGSFLAFVAAMILTGGEDATRDWLEGLAANGAVGFSGNSAIVAAVNDGEAAAGLANHYYLLQLQAQVGETRARNHFLAGGPGALVMPAGAGLLAGSAHRDAALEFIEFLLSDEAQRFVARESFEYPLVAGIDPDPGLPALDTLRPPDLDLSRLAETIDTATDLVAEAGLL